MTIRKAEPSDLGAIESIAVLAYQKYVKRIGKKPAPMVADFALQIEAGTVYVSVDGRKVRGFVVFYPRGDHMHLENVAVGPDMQGRGIGAQLVRFVEEVARTGRFDAVELYTNEKMQENFAFYQRLGYQEVGRWEEDGFNRVFYRKELL